MCCFVRLATCAGKLTPPMFYNAPLGTLIRTPISIANSLLYKLINFNSFSNSSSNIFFVISQRFYFQLQSLGIVSLYFLKILNKYKENKL